ncbi:MAG: hypothetical protein FJ020_07045 [Chloroflexi bacterium]|nr:hypothetical protein [Chloroflexota bacterium]
MWGHIPKKRYLAEKRQIQSDLTRLVPVQTPGEEIDRVAQSLADTVKARDAATQEQKNALARCLFQEIWVRDGVVVAVQPQPDFEPFFKMNWEECSRTTK